MACHTRPGVKPFIDYIEKQTGEHITQQDWHELRQWVHERTGADVSRTRVSDEDRDNIIYNCVQHSSTMREDQQALTDALGDAPVTQGTMMSVAYLNAMGASKALKMVRDQRALNKQVADLKAAADPTKPFTPPATAEDAKGRTLYMSEQNGYDDSDFSGLFYDPASGKFGTVTTGSTASSGGFIPKPDATEAVVALYREHYEKKYEEMLDRLAEYDAHVPSEGKEVRIDGGRKHAGKTGTVVWFGDDDYKSTKNGTHHRVGVQTEDGETFYVPAEYARVKVGDEFVEPKGTYTSNNSMFGSERDAIMGGFAMGNPSPEQVERATGFGNR